MSLRFFEFEDIGKVLAFSKQSVLSLVIEF